jgi:hypothetical protein
MKHLATHPQPLEDCFGCKAVTLRIAPSATPTREGGGEPVTRVLEREKRWERDMPAYKRCVDAGAEPQSIDGCADLEVRADIAEQVTTGMVDVKPETFKNYEQVFGHKVTEPQLTGASDG